MAQMMTYAQETDWEEARNDTATIGTTSSMIAKQRRGRRVIYIRNTSTASQVITISFGPQAAVANSGIVLNVNDYIIDSSTGQSGDLYRCFAGQIQAISSAGGGTVAIHER